MVRPALRVHCEYVRYHQTCWLTPAVFEYKPLGHLQEAMTDTHLILCCDLVQLLLACLLVERLGVLGRAVVVIDTTFAHDVRHFLE